MKIEKKLQIDRQVITEFFFLDQKSNEYRNGSWKEIPVVAISRSLIMCLIPTASVSLLIRARSRGLKVINKFAMKLIQ